MGCILVIVALAVPRFALSIIFLMTDWLARAFETRLWPLLGFLVMPYTTLAYMAAMLNAEVIINVTQNGPDVEILGMGTLNLDSTTSPLRVSIGGEPTQGVFVNGLRAECPQCLATCLKSRL